MLLSVKYLLGCQLLSYICGANTICIMLQQKHSCIEVAAFFFGFRMNLVVFGDGFFFFSSRSMLLTAEIANSQSRQISSTHSIQENQFDFSTS